MLALHPPPIENQGPRYGQEADTESTAISWPYGTGVADSLRVPHRLKTPGEKGHHSGQVVLEYQLWEAAFKVKPTIPLAPRADVLWKLIPSPVHDQHEFLTGTNISMV